MSGRPAVHDVLAAEPRAAMGAVHALHATGRADVALVSVGDVPLARSSGRA